MLRAILFLVIFCFLIFPIRAQNTSDSGGRPMINPPYYFNYGYLISRGETEFYAPYIGAGMKTSPFSIAAFAQTGILIRHKIFTWNLEYSQGLMPDIAFFPDYNKLEYYASQTFTLNFDSVRLSSVAKFGKMLQAFPSATEEELERNVFTTMTFRKILALDAQFYNDDLSIFSGTFECGFDYVPFYHQSSFYLRTEIPMTFDFIGVKIGLMPSLFYTRYLSDAQTLIIGRKYIGYDAAVPLTGIAETDYFNQWYDFTGALDFICRIYLRSLPSPADRVYIAFGGNIGFGTYLQKKGKTDLLYTAVAAFGYELYDIVPFEIRFSLDQQARAFVNLTVISPIAHRNDNRPK